MSITQTIVVASVAALIGFSVSSGAAQATNAAGFKSRFGIQDDTGLSTLGVDITTAGSTPENIQRFLAGLRGDQAAQIQTGCEHVVAHQVYQNHAVLSFCQAVTGKR